METQIAPTFTELLRPFRTTAIAEALGVSTVQVTAYKAGRQFPSPAKYEALADFLKVDVAVIVRFAAARRAR